MSIEAMKQALEALEAHADIGIKSDKAITALRQAIEQAQKQEPLMTSLKNLKQDICDAVGKKHFAPPRQPLTDEDIELLEWATTTLSSFSAPDRPVGAWKFVYMPKLGELRNLVQKHKAAHGIKGEV